MEQPDLGERLHIARYRAPWPLKRRRKLRDRVRLTPRHLAQSNALRRDESQHVLYGLKGDALLGLDELAAGQLARPLKSAR
jgi:hypothetical protein